MSSRLGAVKKLTPYLFVIVGAVWLVTVYAAGPLLLWPVLACVAGGLLLRLRPTMRISSAWAMAAAVLGFVLAAYQAYVAVPLLSGSFSTVAGEAVGAFSVFAAVHLFLLWGARAGQPAQPR